MPIYEYECEQCGAVFEVMHGMSAPGPTTCEKCGAGPVQKRISATSFHLKGGGWYKDLYSSSKPGGGEKKEGPAEKADKKEGGEKKATAEKKPAKGSE